MGNRGLRRRGERLIADDPIVLYHIQSLGFRATCRIHLDDGRSVAGFRLPHIALPERVVRLLACFVMPFALLVRTMVPILLKRRFPGRLVASFPLIVLLLCCRAAGAFRGFISGAGDSPWRIR